MKIPNLYVNVHQTMWACIAVVGLGVYIFNFKGVRDDVNDLIAGRR